MRKQRVRLVLNAVIAAAVFTVWILSFFFWRDATLGGDGWSDLKYFTVESNLLVGLVAAICLGYRLTTRKERVPKWLSLLKYISATAVFVTFTIVLVFLGPLYGYGRMYSGANLFFHLLIPLAAISEDVFLQEERITLRESLLVMIPPFLYGVGYLINCLVKGIGDWPNRNDWYSFLEWGYGVGVLIFIVICSIAWGLGIALRAMKLAVIKKKEKDSENR